MARGLVWFLVLAALSVPSAALAAETFEKLNITAPPLEPVLPNPCAGESVVLDGEFRVVVFIHGDSRGGLHVLVHVNAKGISATGASSGATYRISGVLNNTNNQRTLTSGQREFTFLDVSHFTRPGAGGDFFARFLWHVTIDADGTPTATIVDLDSACH